MKKERVIKWGKAHKLWLAAGIVVIGILAGFSWNAYQDYRLSRDPHREAQYLVQRVGSHMILPKDEQPGVMTVVDKTKIQNIPFLQRSAENDDKVLVYSKAKKVILYRPSVDRIVDIGPVSIAEPPKDAQ